MNKVKMFTLTPAGLPERLMQIPSPPKLLYCAGTLSMEELLSKPIVAVVGSRKVDRYGSHVTTMLARGLAERGVIIVSGLAYGVDALAHTACLEAGQPSIGVIASGIANPTPSGTIAIARRIVSNGVLVSEHDGNYEPFKHDFLIRNRLIAGIADAVVVPQAAARSGSLNTAQHALEQGRTVMAVPGDITNPLSEGPNNLIKMGATPVTSVDDVLAVLNISNDPMQKNYDLLATNEAERLIIGLLQQGVVDGDALQQLSKLSAAECGSHLTMLELRGIIAPLGANRWTLK